MSDETVDRGIRDNYTIEKRLGKGAYGIVWRATDKKTGKTVALKKIFDAFRNVTDAQRTFREIIYLQGFSAHANIISLLDVVKADNDKDIYLVFDHMDADLHMVNKAKLLAPVHIPHVLTQCFKALHYMHTGGVIHRDLKPSNILMDDSAKAALADFGLARSVTSIPEANGGIDPTMTDYVATRWYRSPEILLGSTAYTCGTDIWSMGCILGEMLLGDPIFQGSSSIHQLDLITQLVGHPSPSDVDSLNAQYARGTFEQIIQLGKRRRSPESRFPNADPQALDLLMKLLVVDPSKRLTTGEALQHPYLAPHMGSAAPMVSDAQVVTPFDDNQRLYGARLSAEIYTRGCHLFPRLLA
jgi:mitogen-activated protein kinase 15